MNNKQIINNVNNNIDSSIPCNTNGNISPINLRHFDLSTTARISSVQQLLDKKKVFILKLFFGTKEPWNRKDLLENIIKIAHGIVARNLEYKNNKNLDDIYDNLFTLLSGFIMHNFNSQLDFDNEFYVLGTNIEKLYGKYINNASFGIAQKVINVTLKYYFLAVDIFGSPLSNNVSINQDWLHCPIDREIIVNLRKTIKSYNNITFNADGTVTINGTKKCWSKLAGDEYFDIQKAIKSCHVYNSNLEYDYYNW